MKGNIQTFPMYLNSDENTVMLKHRIQPLSVALEHNWWESAPVVFCLVDWDSRLPTGQHRFRWVRDSFNTDAFGSTVFQFVGTLIVNSVPMHLFYLGNEFDAE